MDFSRINWFKAIVATCGSLFWSATVTAFVTYQSSERSKSGVNGYSAARVLIDTNALFGVDQAKTTKNLVLQLPTGKRYNVVRANVLSGLDNGKTFVGYFESHGEDYRIYINDTQGAISGVMYSPEGSIELSSLTNSVGSNALLTARTKAGLTKAFNFGADTKIPPGAEAEAILFNANRDALLASEQFKEARDRAKAGAQVTIDLLVAYTAGMTARHSNTAGVVSRLNVLVAKMNDALAQSQVNLTIRLVNASQVNYSDVGTNDAALTAISPGSKDALKATVDALRDQYKADLVALVRPYNQATHSGCGLAWILGYGGVGVKAGDAGYAFSAISDGQDTAGSGYYCDDLSFSHELGHNLGISHDRANAKGIVGATNYAYGYINSAAGFGTIMSYASNRIVRYSNPDVVCSGAPCGVARTDTANSADAAGTILTTMGAISAFRTAVVPTANQDSDGDGIPDTVEAVEGTQVNLKDNAIFAGMATNSDRLFAMQQYRDFLGREADTTGLAGWTDLLQTKTLSREEVVKRFFDSQEFQNGVPSVVRLYLGYFKRIPDHSGLWGWVGALRGGQALKDISGAFSGSAEFQLTYGALNNSQFVTLVYQNVLGRSPDKAGFDGWVALLNSGTSRGEVMTGFTESQEFRNNTGKRVEVIMLYEGMLRRSAEQAGYDGWVSYLNAGNASVPLISGFLNSIEYRNRFLP